jgi:pimeloyl-ACP methyl ester carboxylesterase
MPQAIANGIQIAYETFGNPQDRPLLLIIGLGGQLIQWDDNLCMDLASRGHYVIRYDNRDAGLSTKFNQASVTDIMEALGKIFNGDKSNVPYMIEDMADDGAGLLTALGIPAAHICGMSMGGMIAQTIALRHPSQVLSLTSIYSNTGNPELPPPPKPEVMAALIAPPPAERAAYVEHMLGVFKLLAGRAYPPDEGWTRRIMAASFDRCFYPQGMGRQLMAVLTQNNRKAALASVKVPVLVIHGTDDPLVPMEGGKETAAVVPGAKLILIEGMGHDLPHGGAWPQIVEAITAHTRTATKQG